MNNKSSYLPASWFESGVGGFHGKPGNVQAVTTLRKGGVSTGDFCEYNLATHVNDDLQAVKTNREKLKQDLQLPSEPFWLEQVHSNKVVCIDDIDNIQASAPAVIQADASISRNKGKVCVVLTADCLPVFFCNQAGTEVAVAHAGWRGLHAGIISNTIKAMHSSSDELLVSLGPAIGAKVFEVGNEVMQAFVEKDRNNLEAFTETRKGHYLCDIYQLARTELQSAGISRIAGGGYCSYTEKHRFYSYRRQHNTGRMASLIWLK